MEIFTFCRQCGVNQSVVTDHEHDGRAVCSICGVAVDISVLDVFISYSHKDAAFALQLSAQLWTAGIPNWLADANLEPGDNFAQGIPRALDLAKLVVLLLTPESATSRWVRRELVYATNAGLDILPVRLKNFQLPSDIACMIGSVLYANVFDRPDAAAIDDVCRHVHAKLRKLAAVGSQAVPVIEPASHLVPLLGVRHDIDRYVGPGPYSVKQATLFVGRETVSRSILEALQQRCVALYAPSGAGKSSLIHARIRNSLEEAGWEVLVGGPIRIDLPRELLGGISNCFSFQVNRGLTDPDLPKPTRGVAEQLHAMARYRSSGRRILILDQFEEFFTHHNDRHEHRADFFADLSNALEADPGLRILVAFRDEYLANFEEHTEGMEGRFTRIHLKRMNDAEACEVITRPVDRYVKFAPGVAERIVKALHSRRERRPDGTIVLRRVQFVELVHLQIVCKQLWLNLEEGLTDIEMKHLECAAGGGKTFERFVENVLQEFVNQTVKRVAATNHTTPELIHFGLLKFVTKSASRVTLPMDGGRNRTGRLRNEIIDQLAAEHLLRAETRGDERWLELSHDLLVEPVAQHKDPDLTKLLAVTDLLTTLLDRAREECEAAGQPDGQLTGYFGPHRELLEECERVYDPQILDAADESEFMFRASLACRFHMDRWSARLGDTLPEVRESVLRDALCEGRAFEVRANAVTVLGTIPELGRALIPAAVLDKHNEVRDAAATSLAELDVPALYAQVVDVLARDADGRSTRTLASVLTEAEKHGVTSHAAAFRVLGRRTRRRVRLVSWWMRLRRDISSLFYVVLVATILCGIGTGLFKAFPTGFDVGIAQAEGSFFLGFYHGLVAGATYGALISLALSVHYLISPRPRSKLRTPSSEQAAPSYLRPVLPIFIGLVSGALSGLLVDLIIMGVYAPATLTRMRWIITDDIRRWQLFHDVFMNSRYGWCFVISGTVLGCSVALVANRLRNQDDWLPLLDLQSELVSLRHAVKVTKRIARLVLPHAWPILVMLAIAAPLTAPHVIPYLDVGPSGASAKTAPKSCQGPLKRRQSIGIQWDVAADFGCQVSGGFFLIVGMGLGIVLLRRGLHISRRHRA